MNDPAAAPVKPKSMTVFGILNIIFGALGLCGTAATIPMFLVDASTAAAEENPMLQIMHDSPAYHGFMLVSVVLGLVACIALILAGIGLLQGKAWGRSISIIYAWYAIVAAVVGIIFNWFYLIQPLIEQAQQQSGSSPEEIGAMVGGAVGGLAGGCFGALYPIILLIFMHRPAIKQYLAQT